MGARVASRSSPSGADQPASERAAAEVRRLCAMLIEEMRLQGVNTSQVSRALGLASATLGRTLRGEIPLKLVTVAATLDVLGLSPVAFFARRYPLGGGAGRTEPSTTECYLSALLCSRGLVPETAEVEARAARLLRARIAASPHTQRAISRELGLEPDSLGHALRGDAHLRVLHVFGILAVLGQSARGFFGEVFSSQAPRDGELTELLARVEEVLRRTIDLG